MALKVAYLVSLLAAAIAAPESRIMGGTPITVEEFPYAAAILYHYPGPGITVQRCVGGIISSFHVVTTAFCFTGAVLNNMSIRAGSTNTMSGGVTATVRDVVKHPGYTESPRSSDIAVVFLENFLAITPTVQHLFLPLQDQYLPDWTQTQVVGWGFESDQNPIPNDSLKRLDVLMMPLTSCQENYANYENVAIGDRVVCGVRVASTGMCLGDDGAPMVIGRHLVGISSYAVGCASGQYPDVYTRIDRYTNWILQITTGQSKSRSLTNSKDI